MKKLILILSLILSQSTMAANFQEKNKTVIDAIIKAADRAEIPRELLLTICYIESSFRTKGVTHIDGGTLSHSICQVKLATAKFMDKVYSHKYKATYDRLEDPFINAYYAAKLLKYNLERYDDNWKLAIDAYNRGTALKENTKYTRKFTKYLSFIKSELKERIGYVEKR